MKPYIFFLLMTIRVSVAVAQKAPANADATVTGIVQIETGKATATVEMIYKIYPERSETDNLNFLFSKSNRILSIEGKEVVTYFHDTTKKGPSPLQINLTKRLQKGKAIEFGIKYTVSLNPAALQAGFCELGLDWFWFPVHPAINEWKLLYKLIIKLDDPGYSLFSNGKAKKKGAGTYVLRSVVPDFDINIFLLKDAGLSSSKDKKVIVAGPKSSIQLLDSICSEITGILAFFKQLYGTSPPLTAVFRPAARGVEDFGYYRKGYFVLPQPRNLGSIRKSVAHELAHFWFLNGEPYENAWITESFAEFNSLLYLRYKDGEAAFNRAVQEKYERLRKAETDSIAVPKVFGTGKKGKTRYDYLALYEKGPVVLFELKQLIGEAALIQILKDMAATKASTTENFLGIVRRHGGIAASEQVLKWLKEK